MYEYLSQLLREQDGVIMVYSVTDASTLVDLVRFHDAILREQELCGFLPRVLAANKCDLTRDRKVSEEEGREKAKQFGAVYVETSAKTALNVHNAFEFLIREIRRNPKAKPPAKPTGCVCILS
eukprot:TRINITY_DN2771_c0_g1_i2.p2 TRINITY_DN2771_c0_g1~~TRINITY_DN2771_c0_g1_i2.p2  ORF type:complete len:123 (-),score=28.28 TRINITY_DN2771_c0_g1_i2:42-410(-)